MKYNQIIKNLLKESKSLVSKQSINLRHRQLLDIMQEYLGWRFDYDNATITSNHIIQIKCLDPNKEEWLVKIVNGMSSNITIERSGRELDISAYLDVFERKIINKQLNKHGTFVSIGLETDDIKIADDFLVFKDPDELIQSNKLKYVVGKLKYYQYNLNIYFFSWISFHSGPRYSQERYEKAMLIFEDPESYIQQHLQDIEFVVEIKNRIYNHKLTLTISELDYIRLHKDHEISHAEDVEDVIPPQVKAAVAHQNNDPKGLVNNLADLF